MENMFDIIKKNMTIDNKWTLYMSFKKKVDLIYEMCYQHISNTQFLIFCINLVNHSYILTNKKEYVENHMFKSVLLLTLFFCILFP